MRLTPEYPLEAVGNVLRFAKRNAVSATSAALLFASGLALRDPGLYNVNPTTGEGWGVNYRFSSSSLSFRLGFKSDGIRPVPCGEESPLVPTAFRMREYVLAFNLDRGLPLVEPKVLDYTTATDPRSACHPSWMREIELEG